MTVFTNGRVSIAYPPLGLAVLAEGEGWVPLELPASGKFEQVAAALDRNPTFPWWDEFDRLRAAVCGTG